MTESLAQQLRRVLTMVAAQASVSREFGHDCVDVVIRETEGWHTPITILSARTTDPLDTDAVRIKVV